MKAPEECISLGEIREHIDELDRQIITLIGTRFKYVREVMKFKSSKVEVVAQERFNEVISSRRQLAVEQNLSPDVIESVYRTLLSYFIEEEYRILEKNRNRNI